MKPPRVRIAPSPTGENLHIGNAYTALINYVFALKNQGKFIVRIEDTDRTRLVEGSETRILESLAWLGIKHDEGPDIGGPFGPYRQSDRLDSYRKYATDLIEKGYAYYCFCTPERLAEMRSSQDSRHLAPMYDRQCRRISPSEAAGRVSKGEKHVIRLKVPDSGKTIFQDLIRGLIEFENKVIDDQVILKSDGFPTYHLGVVVDDHLMEITHIIRGEEWISSTPKHILLYEYFGWDKPVFAHMPLLRNPDKSKLSKRKNPVWVSWYRDAGFLPEAVRNYLATMAWSHPEGQEIFDTKEMASVFKLESIQTTAPVFNIEKLRWVNGEYMRLLKDADLKAGILDYEKKLSGTQSALLDRIIPLIRERMKTFSEFWSLAGFFFGRPEEYESTPDINCLEILYNTLMEAEWSHVALEKAVRDAADIKSIRAKNLFMQLRIAITGKTVGPPLLESMEILGKKESLERLKV